MSIKLDREKDKVNQERYQIILNSLLKDEENKYCADCDAKGPRWASWNLGVFLCIRCAGIHRNLGCHVSRIKSINLDTWKAEQLQLLQEIGNSRARAIYEASVPDTFRRPQTDSALEAFIRAKYEHKKYMAKEWIPPSQAYLKAKAKDLEDNIEREIKDKKKKRTHAASASAGLGKVGLPKDQPRPESAHGEENHSVPTLFGSGKEMDLVNKKGATTTQGTKQAQPQDLLLQIDQLSPQTKVHSKVDEFNDFLFASVLPEAMSGDSGSTKPKVSSVITPFESFPIDNGFNNTSILTNTLTFDPSPFASGGVNNGNVNLLSNINPNPNSKEAILALYGNSLSANQNFQSLGTNNHHPINQPKDYAPFSGNNNNATRFQNTQFQQDYLKQVQNQLASLGVVNDASTKTPMVQSDSLI